MASRTYPIRIDTKFFEDLMPGESVSTRVNAIIDRYTALMDADENRLAWSDDEWADLVDTYTSMPSSTRDAAGRERFTVNLGGLAGAELVQRIRGLTLANFFALIEQIEVETYSPKRKEA